MYTSNSTQSPFADLESWLAAVADPRRLTPIETETIWQKAKQTYPALLLAGHKRGQAKRALAAWLFKHVPGIGDCQSADSLLRQLNRKLDREDLADKRRVAGVARRAPELTCEDRKVLVQAAVLECGGQLDFAWRLCLRKKRFGAGILQRYPVPKNRHATCPKPIRRQVSAEIEVLYRHHVGPHKTSNSIAPVERDWSRVFAQDRYEIDDKTLDVRCRFFYQEDGETKQKIIRPQMLLVIDSKSGKALGKVLIAENNYSSLSAKTVCREVFNATGLPGEFLMECGIWKRAKLLGNKNDKKICSSFEQVGNFCTRVGVKLSHALPGRARTKTIENRFKLIDKHMFKLPGYIGSDEMHQKFERVNDESLLTFDELDAEVDKLLDEYNNTPQVSKTMGGFYTPNDVWEKCRRMTAAGTPEPVTFVDERFEYLLTNHVETAKLTMNGVRLTVASQTYQYYDESLVTFGRSLLGQRVKVWFDPDAPETAVISDLKATEFISARLLPKAPAIAVTSEDWKRYQEASAPHRNATRQLRERYTVIKLGYVAPARTNVADAESIVRAQKMADAKEKAAERHDREPVEDARVEEARVKEMFNRRDWESYDLQMDIYLNRPEWEVEKPVPPNEPRPADDPDALPESRTQSAQVVSDFITPRAARHAALEKLRQETAHLM